MLLKRTPSEPKPFAARIETEVTLYFTEDVVPDTEDPLVWWCKNQAHYPLLAGLARKFLCVPATSAPAELVFSICGVVVNKLRCSLSPGSIDALVFLCKNQVLQPTLQQLQGDNRPSEVREVTNLSEEELEGLDPAYPDLSMEDDDETHSDSDQ